MKASLMAVYPVGLKVDCLAFVVVLAMVDGKGVALVVRRERLED